MLHIKKHPLNNFFISPHVVVFFLYGHNYHKYTLYTRDNNILYYIFDHNCTIYVIIISYIYDHKYYFIYTPYDHNFIYTSYEIYILHMINPWFPSSWFCSWMVGDRCEWRSKSEPGNRVVRGRCFNFCLGFLLSKYLLVSYKLN